MIWAVVMMQADSDAIKSKVAICTGGWDAMQSL